MLSKLLHVGVVAMGADMYRVGSDTSDEPGSYFRLNWSGVSEAVEELAAVGVMRYAQCPPYPDEGSDADKEAWRTGVEPGDHVGIATYKFGSNDGWLVGPGEIRTSVAWADHHHERWRDDLSDYVRKFVEWMESTVPYGGFEVH